MVQGRKADDVSLTHTISKMHVARILVWAERVVGEQPSSSPVALNLSGGLLSIVILMGYVHI